MAAFHFYAMSEEDQAILRDNPRRCVALLRPCKPLADRLAVTGGIYAPLSVDDERLLQGFHLVQQSHEGYEYEGAFDQVCSRAGLLHSDVGLLGGRVLSLLTFVCTGLWLSSALMRVVRIIGRSLPKVVLRHIKCACLLSPTSTTWYT